MKTRDQLTCSASKLFHNLSEHTCDMSDISWSRDVLHMVHNDGSIAGSTRCTACEILYTLSRRTDSPDTATALILFLNYMRTFIAFCSYSNVSNNAKLSNSFDLRDYLTYPPQVIAQQVHNHQVLSLVLL